MLFVGGSRAHHYQDSFREIGMNHCRGYELPTGTITKAGGFARLKVEPTAVTLEELHVEPDPERFRPRLSAGLSQAEKPASPLRNTRHDGGRTTAPW